MRIVCDICGRQYRNEAPILVGKVTEGKLSMQEPDHPKEDYWMPSCKCKPMTPRVDNA